MDSKQLSASAQRVQEYLASRGVDLTVLELPGSTRTAVDAAAAVGCELGQIVKSLVFATKDTNEPVLVLASGPNMVNEKLVAQVLGRKIHKADADMVKRETGFAIGGVPPVGHLKPLVTVMDEDLLQYEEVWAAAGTPHALFSLSPQVLVELAGPVVARVKR